MILSNRPSGNMAAIDVKGWNLLDNHQVRKNILYRNKKGFLICLFLGEFGVIIVDQ
jgi:hypothetical protein